MRKILSSPLVRISFGLSMLTVSMLLFTDFIGLVPDTRRAELQSRKIITESLAVQLSEQISDQGLESIKEVLRSVVERNGNVLSAAVRKSSDDLLIEFGDHDRYWTAQPDDKSTPTNIHVPLFDKQEPWGSVELSFKSLGDSAGLLSTAGSFATLTLFIAVAGFIVYLLFLKRTMRELNPDSVIPERVRKALDTMSEGLLILDNAGYIVFSNKAFASRIGLPLKDLLGKDSAKFNWVMDAQDPDGGELPWKLVLEGKELPNGLTIKLQTEFEKTYTFGVNASPITGGGDRIRGVLITFDDITEVEATNQELRHTLGKLEQSRLDVMRQNQQLQILATRDPLTDVLNRRSLFQGFDTLFAEAVAEKEDICCIMVDIDHFKSVNDRFGHAVGDKVIKLLVKYLTEHSRSQDLVGRIGGEEFCVVLPGLDANDAAKVAERMRLAIQNRDGARFTDDTMRITSSFGVASLFDGAANPKELVDQADKALYSAKESGRNRVVRWSRSLAEQASGANPETPSVDQILESAEQPSRGQIPEDGGGTPGFPEESQDPEDGIGMLPIQAALPDQAHPENQRPLDIELTHCGPTQVSNRVLLYDRLDQSIKRTYRHDTKIAVLVMDADTLQRISDTLGLEAAEKLAKVITTRLKKTLRPTDTVTLVEKDELLFTISRLDTNEIVILLTDLTQTEIVTNIIQRLFSVVEKSVEVDGHEIYLGVNVGVSLFPLDGGDPETLIKNASSAMSEAKKSPGRNNFRFYSENINRRAEKQIQLEAELHRALDKDELTVYYQPKVDLKTGTILGMEALVRWQHPQLGLVPPNEFIPIAEQTGLIEQIGQWVTRAACRQIRFWRDSGFGTISVAVNLSPVELRNRDLGDQVIALLEEFRIPGSALELEITETVVMQNLDIAVGILEKLSNAGVSISVDDFGIGYSSLSYLKRLPLHKVKIDRSFVSEFTQGSNDAAIVSAIIAMSHNLGLRVVAEGVETEEQLRFLQDLHCDEMQGYLVSRPVPGDAVKDLLARASSIQRMILDYGVDYAGLMDQQSFGSASRMLGILNDFSTRDPRPLN